MSEETKETVTIVFRTPAGDANGLHERRVPSVPTSQAEQIAIDFAEYGHSGSDGSRYQLYRFEGEGEERLMALDFEEVVLVTV